MSSMDSQRTCPECDFAEAHSHLNYNRGDVLETCGRCGYRYERSLGRAQMNYEDGEEPKMEHTERLTRRLHSTCVYSRTSLPDGGGSVECRTPEDLARFVAELRRAPSEYEFALYTSYEDGIWRLNDVFSDTCFRFDSYEDRRRAIAESRRAKASAGADAAGGAAC